MTSGSGHSSFSSNRLERWLLLCCVMLLAATVLGAPAALAKTMNTVKVKTDKLPKPMLVKASNPVVTVKLKANPSTGYTWLLTTYDYHLVQPLSAKYYSPKPARPGASGYMIWKFKLKKAAFTVPHKTYILLQYARPWTTVNTKEKIIVIVTARP